KFSLDDFIGYANKLVLELHYYNIISTDTNCTAVQLNLDKAGFAALSGKAAVTMPVMMTEFGFAQDATSWKNLYASCLEAYLPAQEAGWMIWALSGSYYIREGKQDYDEPWGLLSHDWSGWRSL